MRYSFHARSLAGVRAPLREAAPLLLLAPGALGALPPALDQLGLGLVSGWLAARLARRLRGMWSGWGQRGTFERAFAASAVGISVLDHEGRIVEVNPAFAAFLGRSRSALVGRPAATFSPADDDAITREPERELRAGTRDTVVVEKRFVRPDGEIRWGQLSLARLELGDGTGLISVCQDITDRKGLEARLAHQTLHDALTGLANRALFLDRLARALREGTHAATGAGVVIVDLDGFRRVNDALGSARGDQVLTEVAMRLLHATRGVDTVARLGGDEFGVLVVDARSTTDVARVVDRITQALDQPVVLDDVAVTPRASVGIATVLPPASMEDVTPEGLVRDAGVAVATAKRQGGGAAVYFGPALAASRPHDLALEADLRHALAQAEPGRDFPVMFQPIVDLTEGQVIGGEALVRWQHPVRGLVPPLDFIPMAEETGLIVSLGAHVLHEACRQAALWHADAAGTDGGAPPLNLSVNVSVRQLQHAEFEAEVRRALVESRLPPSTLTIEITESALVQETGSVIERLATLRELGVRIAVDDFGTGYSSLSYLRRLPVDVLKVDRAFVDGVARSGSEAALTRTIVALGETLGLRTVAEGVETAVQATQLRGMGCMSAQGWLYGRPMIAADFRQLLAQQRAARAAGLAMPAPTA
jgi:diguanylate cyclase (GGDEF)-like protein/PAS domain S-box-containing protein